MPYKKLVDSFNQITEGHDQKINSIFHHIMDYIHPLATKWAKWFIYLAFIKNKQSVHKNWSRTENKYSVEVQADYTGKRMSG